jgi:type I restriction enzyme M protein
MRWVLSLKDSLKQVGLDMKEVKGSSGANLGFEEKIWKAADKLRNNMDAAEYKHVVLGLVFLKYISDAFKEVHEELVNDPEKLSDPEEIDEYKMRNVFWVPPEARWDQLQKNAKQPTIGTIVDDAMDAMRYAIHYWKSKNKKGDNNVYRIRY